MLSESKRIRLLTFNQQLQQHQEMNGNFYLHVSPGGFNLQTLQMDYNLIIKNADPQQPGGIQDVLRIKTDTISSLSMTNASDANPAQPQLIVITYQLNRVAQQVMFEILEQHLNVQKEKCKAVEYLNSLNTVF